MSKLVEKVNLPVYGEMYIACAEEASLEAMQALQEPLKKLYEYEQEEESGTLSHLPCKVGDTVYEPRPDRGFISVYEITLITISGTSIFYKWMLIDGIYSNLDGFSNDKIGKTVFLNREDAENKMKEMEASENAERKY